MRNLFGIRSQMGIRKRLFLLFLAVFVPLLLLEVFIFYRWYEDRKEAEMLANLELARAVGKNFETFLQGLVRSEVSVGLTLTASRSITDQDRNRILDTFAANNPAARSVMWMNPDGLVVAASYRPHIGYNLSDRSFFTHVKEGRDWAVSELIIGRETKKPTVTIGCGIRDKHGRLLGVVAFGTELDRLDTVFGIPRSKDAGVSLIDNKGMHAYRYPPTELTWEQRNWLKLYPVPLREALKGKEVFITQVSKIRGTNRLVAFVPIPSIGWVASCSRAEKEVMAGIVRSLLPHAMLMLLVTLGAFGVAVGLSRPITASLLKLGHQAEAVGRGERERVEAEAAPGELMKLADTLNQMTEKIRLKGEALRESEERLRLAQEAGHVGIWDFNFATEELRWTPELEAIYGLEPGTVRTYQDFATHVYPDDLKTMETKRNEAVNQQKTFEYEFRIQRPCGETAWVYCRGGATYDLAGRPTRVFGVNIDITERKRTEEALRAAYGELDKRVQERTSELSEAVERLRVENTQRKRLEDTVRESENQVRFFASQCLTAQETERKRVAGELHDSIAASLAAMKFRIDKILEEMNQGQASLESLQDLGLRVTEINNEVRRIMADLRPSILDDLGIIPAMTWFCREFQKTYSHISVENQIGVSEPEVPDSLKTPIFRISQEAMNNIAKYSEASLVNLSLRKEDGKILLKVQDNGQGFDLNTVNKGMGLSTMRERAQLSGGSFDLESTVGKGTLIRVSWKLG